MIKRGFSLMEMMVVLLIVAIIAAVSSPMINKKMLSESDTTSPWTWDTKRDIAWFNANAKSNRTAMIGASNFPTQAGLSSSSYPRFYIQSKDYVPQMMFSDGSNSLLSTFYKEGSLIMSTQRMKEAFSSGMPKSSVAYGGIVNAGANYSTAVGIGATVSAQKEYATAIGSQSTAGGKYSIALGSFVDATEEASTAVGYASHAKAYGATALGYGANATGNDSVALGLATAEGVGAFAVGNYAKAKGEDSIAIGDHAQAEGLNSVAIGSLAYTNTPNEIVLGDSSATVHIKGNLVVDKATLLGAKKGDYYTYVRLSNYTDWNTIGSDGGVAALGKKTGVDEAKLIWNLSGSPSDRRLKNVGEAFKGGLAEIRKLDVYNYTFKKDKNKTPMVGVMAQDLQKIFPNAVIKGEDGYLRIRMEDMFYALVNAVKELDRNIATITKDVKTAIADIASLKAKTDSQAKEITALQEQNKELEKRLAALEKKVK